MKICPNCFSSKIHQQNTCMVCGFVNTQNREMRALPAEKLLHKRYLVGRVLGIGGFGITYVAYDMEQKQRLAIKEYFPVEWAMRMADDCEIVPSSQAKVALYQHGQDVFMNEARILNSLRHVPNIVDVYDFFVENGTAYMVMELLDGYTLSGYLRANGMACMSYEAASNIVKDVGLALHQVHAKMLLHRDVGPDNIMITPNGEIHLIDFGATRMYALNSPNSMSVLVKGGFAPIEQYSRAGNQGPWTDVYALAATYYYLLTGKRPPEAPDRIAGTSVIPLKSLAPDIPQKTNDVVMRAMAENWRERPQSVRAFLLELGLIDNKNKLHRNAWGWQKTTPVQRANGNDERRKRPCVLMQMGNKRSRYYFTKADTLTVGRSEKRCNILINGDTQVSGLHCKLWYDFKAERFMVENYSANRTYTSQGVLDKNQAIYLMKGEWIYIQTTKARYIFYLEVE